MGLFDSIIGLCKCGGKIEYQTKAGNCCLTYYDAAKVPYWLAFAIDGDTSECNSCGKRYLIKTPYKIPETIKMQLVEIKEKGENKHAKKAKD